VKATLSRPNKEISVMGFVQQAMLSTGQPMDFYNLEHAVGRAANNQMNDVKIVQYLLSVLDFDCKIDGMYGPQTSRAMNKYQTTLRSQGFSILPDGRVDRAKGNRAMGTISHTIYTILWLNLQARAYNYNAWASLPQAVYLKPADQVDPEANDYIDAPPCPSQQTSPK